MALSLLDQCETFMANICIVIPIDPEILDNPFFWRCFTLSKLPLSQAFSLLVFRLL